MTAVDAAPTGANESTLTLGVAEYLEPVVIDLTALALEGKQAHWHVRGANFIAVHELLDTVVDHARAGSDQTAERIAALGLPLDARTAAVAQRTTVPAVRSGFQPSGLLIEDMVKAIDAALVTLRAAIDGLGDLDPVSEDIAIGITDQLELDRWFLFSHIAE